VVQSFKKHQFAWICASLTVLTLLCYLPSLRYSFVVFDDYHYLSENPRVTAGLSWSGVVWAFKTGYFCNWHPLTWLSYFLDFQLYGLKPGGYHLTNLIFHVADSLLLLFLLKQMTNRLWPSAFVAALFALHPLHVESVAWVSERKDVLSAFFWILATMAYVQYVKLRAVSNAQSASQAPNQAAIYYCLALVLFACGLMSKAMAVTLPCVLFLLDFWPLRRFVSSASPAPEDSQSSEFSSEFQISNFKFDILKTLIIEKLPFFGLAFAASVVTFLVQDAGGAVASLGGNPLRIRLANALVSYGRYLGKTFWPAHLSVQYPFHEHIPFGVLLSVGVVLGVITVFCFYRAQRQPFLIVGWLWFVGTLVPVIGIIQVGGQSMADRYMYIPSIGLFLLIVWGLDKWLDSQPHKPQLITLTGSAVLAGCLVCTSFQLKHWQDSEHLFRHALEVDPDNYMAHDGLGKALEELGQKDQALESYSSSIRQPNYEQGHYNLGTLLMEKGRLDEAVTQLNAAIKSNPKSVQAYHNLGNAFIKLGRLPEAAASFSKVIELKPKDASARNDLATVLLMESRLDEASVQLREALRLDPEFAEAHRNMGVAYIRQGKTNDAVAHFSKAVQFAPDNPEMRFNLGLALLDQNHPADAAVQFAQGARLKPNDPWMHYRLAVALARQHKTKEAMSEYQEAIRAYPAFADAFNDLAWILATDPNPDLRSGKEAIELSEQACELTKHEKPAMLRTLAAAYAESGRFSEAVATAQKVRELSLAAGEKDAAAKAEDMARLYESGQPFRAAF
jgi:tetratricopeptide (TPR) repeat protein